MLLQGKCKFKYLMFKIKSIIKYLLSKLLTLKFLERLSQNIIWREILKEKRPKITGNAFGNINDDSWNELVRYKVWDKIPDYIDVNKDILYMEFGVWKGESINYFSKKYTSKNSEFYGFDTFYGMPKEWRGLEKGHYQIVFLYFSSFLSIMNKILIKSFHE